VELRRRIPQAGVHLGRRRKKGQGRSLWAITFMRSMLSLVVACNFKINSACCVASKLFCTEDGKGNKSIGARGTKP
jgi:hypothetical protein